MTTINSAYVNGKRTIDIKLSTGAGGTFRKPGTPAVLLEGRELVPVAVPVDELAEALSALDIEGLSVSYTKPEPNFPTSSGSVIDVTTKATTYRFMRGAQVWRAHTDLTMTYTDDTLRGFIQRMSVKLDVVLDGSEL